VVVFSIGPDLLCQPACAAIHNQTTAFDQQPAHIPAHLQVTTLHFCNTAGFHGLMAWLPESAIFLAYWRETIALPPPTSMPTMKNHFGGNHWPRQ
jgi:hypothetical protein